VTDWGDVPDYIEDEPEQLPWHLALFLGLSLLLIIEIVVIAVVNVTS
jgi:hypothetical protein